MYFVIYQCGGDLYNSFTVENAISLATATCILHSKLTSDKASPGSLASLVLRVASLAGA